MSEPGPREGQTPADAGAPAAPPALARPRVVRRRDWVPSLIWLIPIVAAMVGITLVAKVLWNRGPEIVLTFKTAEGLEAGKTAVKYKDVQIGTVHNIRLARDRSHVRVTVELDKNAAELRRAEFGYKKNHSKARHPQAPPGATPLCCLL